MLSILCHTTVSVPLDVIDEVAVISPAVNLLIVAFVVVEFPTIRSVILAKRATRLEKNPLVEVELVVTLSPV